jgi:hypothetical protein
LFKRLGAYFAILATLACIMPVNASDPLRLNENFRLLDLTSYMRPVDGGGHVFAVQNGGGEDLALILHHLPQNDLARAIGLQAAAPPLLRLFSSDDREFAGQPGASEKLKFTVPAGQVQSFFLPPLEPKDAVPQLFLWSPEALSAYEGSRQTFHSTVLLLLSLLSLLAIGVAVVRRSRRAAYAVVMGGGLMVLLGSLWMRDVLPRGSLDYLLVNRLDSIRIALAIGALMSVLAHLNLVVKHIVNRNYWTRVIIVSDIILSSFAIFFIWQIYAPNFAGLLSVELSQMALAMTCATVLLGAVFVPDRRP